ncbi:transmembrane protein 104 homolog [Diaphorina citri]|uniref:Transmembrane protein 104 homolog n=1 Tax=Diaphorina citri TaxID=121845 RepID=A0A1S3DVC5_DIACI|nr:transmembrane protein 104 homolog [Diaphorina citri]
MMEDAEFTIVNKYSTPTGLIYIFNLVIGTGALTLPKAVHETGWLLGSIFLVLICFFSSISVDTSVDEHFSSENTPLNGTMEVRNTDLFPNFPTEPKVLYTLESKVEMAEMSSMYFSKLGRSLFVLVLVVYLFGDLSIYCATVAKSLVNIVWRFCFIKNFIMGNFRAFFIMTVLATMRLFNKNLPHGRPSPILWDGVSTMFGCGVYSFMCHHSLPSVVTPMRNKSHLVKLTGFDLMLVVLVYLLLSLTGVFAFPSIEDVYSLNFIPDRKTASSGLEILDYFLIMFPVITLSTSFPIIAVTLRNNLQEHVYRACIQYVIPAFIVIFSRADLPEDLKQIPNQFRSPFNSFLWPILILVWAGITIAFVTINHIDKIFQGLITDVAQKVTPGFL